MVVGTVVVVGGDPNTSRVISGWISVTTTNSATSPASTAPIAIHSVRRVHARSAGCGTGFHSSGLGGSSGSTNYAGASGNRAATAAATPRCPMVVSDCRALGTIRSPNAR